MIDIIIPAYNAHKTIDKTLISIAMQDMADKINVYIVNDASDNDYQKQVDYFSKFFNIQELKISKNQGPGYARQYGIDYSNSDYIVFIDSDDIFLNFQAITQLYNNIEQDDCDVVSGVFFEELDNNYLKHSNDTIFMHGKIYKRKFLINHNIRFNNTYSNEDNGFNSLLILNEAKIKFIDDEIYVWRNNKESITRRNNYEYSISGIEGYVYNINWAISIAIKTLCSKDRIAEVNFGCLLSLYYYYLKFEDDNIIKWSIPICKNYLKFQPNEEKEEQLFWAIFNQKINEFNKIKILNPILTFNQFIEKVMLYDNCNELQ